jgi:hypothetical protein
VRLTDRPTGDLLILMIAGTICFAVVASGAALFVTHLLRPDEDVSQAASLVSDTLNTLIGLLAGYVAGRTNLTTASRTTDAVADQPPGPGV